MTAITERLATLRARVLQACRQAGRDPGGVAIVGVSKRHPPAAVRAARAAGLHDFGENYVQEAVAKITQTTAACWHFIGLMQANKTRAIAGHFDWAQTVTSLQLATRLSAQRPFHAPELQVCLQVQPEPAAGRGGVPAAALAGLAEEVAALPRLRLRGLMFMPLAGLDEAALRAEFRRVHGLYMELRELGHELDTLSMGMSDDLELAIAEGSTMLRVGTALFGARSHATPGDAGASREQEGP
ncbi:MAG: YggS family pyridoxal phosphate-dependent enzyme [Gammaproteobacteria bacterium]|nr:YggS family pyridoxal phosphate-dependent enzyme [Gammaproteobacteria bacterium]